MKKIIVLLFLMTFVIAMFPIKTKASTFVWKSLLTKESLFGGMRNDFSPVYHIEIDPSNEKCVYLATWGNGVLKSESNDFSFLPVNNGLEELNVHTLRVSPTNHDKIYAGTATGVFYSDNQGKTFSLLGDLRLEISVIEFGLNDTVYAGVLNEQENAGLYSFDGSRWVELGLKDKDVYSITRLNNSTLLIGTNAGLYEYDEAGKTFKLLGFEDSTINSIAISSKWIVLVTSSGIFKSPTDNFNFISLANLDKKFGENNFTSAAFLKDEDEVLLGSSIDGIYLVNLSTNAFRLLYDPYTPVFSITVSKSGVIFLGVVSGIIWSDDNGVSFKTYVTPRSGIEMKFDPDNPNIIYVGAGDGLYRSVDGGKTFELLGLNDVSVFSIAINPQNKQELLIGTYSGLYKFNSNKNTFQIIETGNPGYAVTKVLFDPKGNIVIGVKDRGVFISEDGGLSFRLILKLGLNDFVSDIEFDPVNQNTFYVAACHLSYCNFEEKVYRTTDYGKNFESLNWIDHALYFYNLDIYIPKNNHNIIYLTGENIYRSDDGGKTFKKISIVSDTGLHLDSPQPYADILISYRLVSDP
ncbi:MAG: hypothetical protein JHC30_08165, partial [Caldisericum sp.]|nr:hypothetical protein [Caldisericum sp.]